MKLANACAALLLAAIHAYPSAAQAFYPIAHLPGAKTTIAVTMTADGMRIFGGSGQESPWLNTTPIQWTKIAGITPLTTIPNGQSASAWDVSADGTTVVGQVINQSAIAPETQAFRWSAETGITPLGDLAGATVHSFAYGVSDDGQTIVGNGTVPASKAIEKSEAFRWTLAEGMQGLGFLLGKTDQSVANDVSGDGKIVVGFSSKFEMVGDFQVTEHEAYRWTKATGMVGLGDLPGGEAWSIANAITDDGKVIVGESWGENGTEAFRWTDADGMLPLGRLPSNSGSSSFSNAHAVSADGSVIVGVSNWHAAVWDEQHGFRSIASILEASGVDLGDWSLLQAFDISADGRTIVGNGIVGDAGPELPWVAILPPNAFAIPEPQTSLLGAICLLIFCRSLAAKRSRPPATPC